MRIFFIVYLFGFIVSCILCKLIYDNDDFYQFMHDTVENEKQRYDLETQQLIDVDHVIKTNIIINMFMSFLGVFRVIFEYLAFLIEKNNEVNK